MRRFQVIGLFLALVLCMSAFIGCTPRVEKFDVTYYDTDNTTVLKTEKVESGKKAPMWTPEKTGYDFVDWFATPTKTHRFDFNTEIKQKTSMYAGFSTFKADTRQYSIVGSGKSSLLSESNWGVVINDKHHMTKTAGKNEYTFTGDFFKDDAFQFAINTSWHHQRGFGYLNTTTGSDGKAYFTGSGGLGDSGAKRSNITCSIDGNYTFTLRTYPADDFYGTDMVGYTEDNKEAFNIGTYDVITWVRNGDTEEEVADNTVDLYIKGANITQWKDMYNSATRMTANADRSVYTMEIYLAQDETFLFSSTNTNDAGTTVGTLYVKYAQLNTASQALFNKSGENIVAKETGTYTFTYTVDTKVLTATLDKTKAPAAADYYLDGTFAEGVTNWQGYCFTDAFKLKAVAGKANTYELTNVAMKKDAEFIIQAFKTGSTAAGDGTDANANRLGSFNVTYLLPNEAFAPVGGNNNNIKILTAGNYDITFDSYAKMITIKKSGAANDLYVKGTMNGWNHNFGADYKFAKTGEGIYELTITLVKDAAFGFALYEEGATTGDGAFINTGALGTDADNVNAKFTQASGSNFTCSEAGTYRFVYNSATGKVNVFAATA